jgi:hypothetical protein
MQWTAVNALDLGQPVTLIAEAVNARSLSAIKAERLATAKIIPTAKHALTLTGADREKFLGNLEKALYASKIISYAQGFMLIQNAALEYKWKLNKPEIALMWRGGCIIRSVLLKDITSAYRKDPNLQNLLWADFFNEAVQNAKDGWKDVIKHCADWEIPIPAFSTAYNFYCGFKKPDLPANLTQAQRDYFGAHTFRIKPQFASEKFPEGKDIHGKLHLDMLTWTDMSSELDWARRRGKRKHLQCLIAVHSPHGHRLPMESTAVITTLGSRVGCDLQNALRGSCKYSVDQIETLFPVWRNGLFLNLAISLPIWNCSILVVRRHHSAANVGRKNPRVWQASLFL